MEVANFVCFVAVQQELYRLREEVQEKEEELNGNQSQLLASGTMTIKFQVSTELIKPIFIHMDPFLNLSECTAYWVNLQKRKYPAMFEN